MTTSIATIKTAWATVEGDLDTLATDLATLTTDLYDATNGAIGSEATASGQPNADRVYLAKLGTEIAILQKALADFEARTIQFAAGAAL